MGDLRQSVLDMSAIWRVEYLSHNLRQLDDDSTNLTLEYGHMSKRVHADSTTHIQLGKGSNIESAFLNCMKRLGHSMSMAFKKAWKNGGGPLPEYWTACSMLQLLSSIDSWQVQACKHSTPLIVPAIAAICISSSSQMLESLMILLQLFQDPSNVHRDMPSDEELNGLKVSLEKYMESSRKAQLESLLNKNGAPAEVLSKADRAVSSAIDHIRSIHATALEECDNLSSEDVHEVSHVSDRTRLATRKHLSSEHPQRSHFCMSITCTDKKENLVARDLSGLLKARGR